MRIEHANMERSLSGQNSADLADALRELRRLRKDRETRGANTAAIDSQITQTQRRCEQIISRR